MATIKKGSYRLNSTLTAIGFWDTYFSHSLYFIDSNGTKTSLSDLIQTYMDSKYLGIIHTAGGTQYIYNFDTNTYMVDYPCGFYLPEDVEGNESWYTWFTENTTMLIKAGTYRFKDAPIIPDGTSLSITFTNASGKVGKFSIEGNDNMTAMTVIGLAEEGQSGALIQYFEGIDACINAYIYGNPAPEGETLGWVYPCQTVTFAEDVFTDSKNVEWFSANTSPVSTEVTEASVKAKIQRLITAANTLTGKSDTDLTGAMWSLAMGYGQGGSSNVAAVYGKWRFNETVEKTSIPSYPYLNITQNVNFTTTIEGTVYQCTGMWVCASNFSDPTILQYQGGGVPSVYRGGMDTWLYDSARNVDFGAEPQIVDPDFKDWLLANATRISSGEDSPLPIEVSSATEMNALLATAEVGSVYKYTGTSGTYENGALYIVEAVS